MADYMLSLTPPDADDKDVLTQWIGIDGYRQLFCWFANCGGHKKSIPIRNTLADAFLISGTIGSNGLISGLQSFVSSGPVNISLEPSSAVKIFTKDPRGSTLQTNSFPFDMNLYLRGKGGIHAISVDEAPFVVAIPYDGTTSSVTVSANQSLPATFSPQNLSLQTAFSMLSDAGIVGDVGQARLEFSEMTNHFSALQLAKRYQQSTDYLRNTIRPRVLVLATDDFSKQSSLDFNRSDVLSAIDKILGKNEELKLSVPEYKNSILDINLDKESYSVGETANLNIKVTGKLTNPDIEIIVRTFLGTTEVPTLRKSEWRWEGKYLSFGSGTLNWNAQAYVQDRRRAAALQQTILKLSNENTGFQMKYNESVDLVEREMLLAKIQKNESIISEAKDNLGKGRRAFGESVTIPLHVD